jgi:hypothetical protein
MAIVARAPEHGGDLRSKSCPETTVGLVRPALVSCNNANAPITIAPIHFKRLFTIVRCKNSMNVSVKANISRHYERDTTLSTGKKVVFRTNCNGILWAPPE